MKSTLFQRWITSLVIGPLVAGIALSNMPVLFAALMTLITVLVVCEYARMTFGTSTRTELAEGILFSLLLLVSAYCERGRFLAGTITGTLIWAVVGYMLRYQKSHEQLQRPDLAVLSKTIFGFIGLPLLLAHLILLYNLPSGMLWFLLLFLIVISGDISAFFVGTKFGRHKLIPAISPAKSREGAVASMVAGMTTAAVFGHFFMPDIALGPMLVFGALTNIMAQLGDLGESMIKRAVGAKDSGSILPGHGGVLDRMDAFLFSAPFVYYFKVILIG